MDYQQLIAQMTPQMHRALKTAVEIGKWPNGERLSDEQRQICLRAVIHYDQQLPEAQRTGFIDRTKGDGSQHGSDSLEPQVLNILSSSEH